jgi:hypothetical protein
MNSCFSPTHFLALEVCASSGPAPLAPPSPGLAGACVYLCVCVRAAACVYVCDRAWEQLSNP